MQNIFVNEYKKRMIFDIINSTNTYEKIQKFEYYKLFLGRCKIFLFDVENSSVDNSFGNYELGKCNICGLGDYTKTWVLDSEDCQEIRVLVLGKTLTFDLNVLTYLNKITMGRKMGEGMDRDEVIGFFHHIKNNGFQIGVPNALMERTKKPFAPRDLLEMIKSYVIYETRDKFYEGMGNKKISKNEKHRIKQLYKLAKRIKDDNYNQYDVIWCCIAKAYLIKKYDNSFTEEKIDKFILFCLNELNCYVENEIVLLAMYILGDDKTIEIFKKLNKQKNVEDHISNIAWDIYHIRCLENIMKLDNAIGKEMIVLPYLATADKGLINAMKINPIKAYVILDDYAIAIRGITVEDVCKNIDILNQVANYERERGIRIKGTNPKEIRIKLSREIQRYIS